MNNENISRNNSHQDLMHLVSKQKNDARSIGRASTLRSIWEWSFAAGVLISKIPINMNNASGVVVFLD